MIRFGSRAVWLSLAGCIAFAVFLVALLPARLVYAWTAPPDLRVEFIHGTIFSGRAERLEVAGFDFGRMRWHLKPTELVRGRLAFMLRADRPDGFLQADVSVGAGGTTRISALEAALPLSIGRALIPIPGVSGDLKLDFELIRLRDGWPDRLKGTLDIDNLTVSEPSVERMGSYRVEFDSDTSSKGGDVTGVFHDTGGPLEVQGSVLISDTRRYRVDGRVLARDSSTGQFGEVLELLLGPPSADGRRSFWFGGRL